MAGFDPKTVQVQEFDPATVVDTPFDPSTADAENPVTASWGDTLKAIPSQIVGAAEQAVGGMSRAFGEGDFEFPAALRIGPMAAMAIPFDAMKHKKKTDPKAFEEAAQFGQDMFDLGKGRLEEAPDDMTFWQKAVTTAAQSGGQAIPLTLGAIVTRSPGLVAAGFGTQEFGRAYGDARAKELPEDEAFRYAVINGLVEAGTEFIPAKQLFKQDQGLVQRLANFMVAEIPGENVAEVSQLVNEWAHDLRDDVTVKDVIDTMALTTAATILGGSGQTTAAHYLEKLAERLPPPPETTLEDIANAPDDKLDALVDEYLQDPEADLPVPDIEAFNEEVAASEAGGGEIPAGELDELMAEQKQTAVPAPQPARVETPESAKLRKQAAGLMLGANFSDDQKAARKERQEAEKLIQQAEGLEDKAAAVPRETDRRQDPKRAIFDKLPPEEREILLRSDVIPALPGKRAFELHMEETPGQRVMFLDYDDFKAVNDKRGEKLTDRTILEPSGEIMQEVRAQFPDVSIFHRSGDEFMATGASDERLQEFATALRERLKTSKFEAILPDGSTDTRDGIGFSYGLGQDEETSRAAAKLNKTERKASGERTGERDTGSVAGPAPAGNQVPAGEVAEPKYISPKLKRLHYRGQLKVLSDSLQRNSGGQLVGGDFSAINDNVERGKETEVRRLPSVNPEWFQRMAANSETSMTVAEVQNAVDRALAGQRLGARQARVVETMLGEIEGRRTEPDQLESAKKERTMARELRELATQGAPPNVLERIPAEFYEDAGQIFEESLYMPEWSGSARSLFELAAMAEEAGFEAEVEAILGKALPNADAAQQLFKLLEGNYSEPPGQGQQDGTAATTEEPGQRAAQTSEAAAEAGPVLDPTGSDTLHANPFGIVYAAYRRLGQKVLTRVHDAFGWKMTPLGKLPAQELYLKERYEALGKIADVEAISKRVWETFGPLDAREAELVYEYFTTKGADPAKLSTKPVKYKWKGNKVESTVRQQAETIKRLIDRIGQQLVERGLLHKDSYEKYEDAYLPRVYLKHIMGDGRQFGAGKKPSDMGYLKERKDIPKEIREIILGEITDPGYLASKSLGKSMRDIAILDWFEQIALQKDWALPDFLVQYKGKPVSIFWLKAESERITQQIPYYTPANQAKAKTIVQQMDAIVARGQKQMGKVTDDYRQVPDNAQHGRLRGMYIRKEIYNDITGIPGNRDPNAEWWQQPFEYGGIGTKVTQLWKMSKVALNPPSQIRNFISNGILLQLSGVGAHRVLPLMIQSIQDIRQNGKHFRIAKKYGVTASTFANNELYRIERELLDLKAKNAGKLSTAQLKRAGAIIGEFAGDMYQLSEAIWKTAKIIDAMKREGKDEVAAVLDAQKWLYDYSLVPQTVRYFRNTPIGVPFLTFYYKTLPRMLEVLATAPHRFAPYIAIPALFTAWIASDYDVEPEDVKKLHLVLPEWLRDHGHLFFLPYKDQHGRWQAFDFSYLLPWSMFEQTMNNLKEGQIGEAAATSGVIGGPVPDMVSAIRTNIDPFTKKPIVDKSDPPAEQVKSIMNYLWSLAAPPWLTDNGFAGKMRDAIMENVNPKTGEPKLTVPQAALRITGLNIYPIEPEAERQRNLRNMGFEIKEIEKRMGERLNDRNLTAEDKKNIRAVYKELIEEKQEQLKDYREASKVHPNLKGEPVKKKAGDENQA